MAPMFIYALCTFFVLGRLDTSHYTIEEAFKVEFLNVNKMIEVWRCHIFSIFTSKIIFKVDSTIWIYKSKFRPQFRKSSFDQEEAQKEKVVRI